MYDLLFLILMGLALWSGYINGFLKAIVNFAGIIASAIGGFLLYPYLSDILVKTPLYTSILNSVSKVLTLKIKDDGLPDLLVKYGVDNLERLSVKMAEGVAVIILNIISVIIIIIAIKVVFFFLKKYANWINDLPIIGKINRIFGMLVSGASAIVIIYILVAVVVMPPSNTTELSKEICRGINNSFLLSRVMDYNFFVNFRSLSNI